MNSKIISSLIFTLLFSHMILWQISPTHAAELDRDLLQKQINDKSAELSQINKQIEETNKTLKETQNQKSSLQKEIKTIDSSVASLNLSIRADELHVEQLGLQIQSLAGDIDDISSSVEAKKNAINNTLRELQKKGETPLLGLILGADTLSDGLRESQTLSDIQTKLFADIRALQGLQDTYRSKLSLSSQKKNETVYHQQDLKNKVVIVQDQKQERQQLLAATRNKESAYQKQMSDLLEKQEKIAKEVEDLDRLARLKIDSSKLPTPHSGALLYPVENGRNLLTQGYGSTDFAKNGYKGHWHNGIDFGIPVGTPILAAEDGVVVGVANEDLYCPRGAYGKFIAINHDNNLSTLYGHLSRQIVAKGDTVKRGQIIGYSGKTGYATGPHLHFTVYAQSTFSIGTSNSCGPLPRGGDLNPLSYL